MVCGAIETNNILIQCGLAVEILHFCSSQDAGGESVLGDVQRPAGSALYGPAEQESWFSEVLDFVRG